MFLSFLLINGILSHSAIQMKMDELLEKFEPVFRECCTVMDKYTEIRVREYQTEKRLCMDETEYLDRDNIAQGESFKEYKAEPEYIRDIREITEEITKSMFEMSLTEDNDCTDTENNEDDTEDNEDELMILRKVERLIYRLKWKVLKAKIEMYE